MSTNITAKVSCNLKQEYGTGANRQATVGYTDGANKEWANATPHLDMRMTLKGDVADHFEPGKHYTVTFTEDTT